jgi:hypothetical protein
MYNTAKTIALSLLLLGMTTLTACRSQSAELYTPGLGEIMGYLQVRHAKLSFAGEKENWQLADYELDELQEGLDDITKFHPTHEKVPMPTDKAVRQFMDQPLQQLRDTIAQKNVSAFTTAFENVTASCNACHTQSNFGFIRVQKPDGSSPYSNQDYAYKP